MPETIAPHKRERKLSSAAISPSQGRPRRGQGSARQRKERARKQRRLIHDLRDGEQVVMLQRKHPSVLLARLLWPLLLGVLWVAALVLGLALAGNLAADGFLQPGGNGSGLPDWLAPLLWFVWLGAGSALVLWAAYLVLDWSDHWIALTTRRVIIMDKTLFFHETRREAPLAKVQNVVADYPNALGTSLNFGNLRVDTSGVGVLAFESLPAPKKMREAIFAQQAALRSKQPPPEDRRKEAVRSIVLGSAPDVSRQSAVGSHEATVGAGTRHSSLASLLFPLSAQRDGARVVWHKHPYFLLRGVGLPLLLLGLALLGWASSLFLGEPGVIGLLESLLGWAALFLAPVCFVWAVWKWEDWRNDVYKLDHERVYHVESLPFGLREQSKETLITRITDVTYVVPGPLANILNYGDVVIKTPGEATEFVFRRIACPREVQGEIMARVDEYRLKEGAGVDREIEAWLRTYHDVTSDE